MSKQDMQGVRTAADLERKYNLASLAGIQKAVQNSEEGLNKTNAILEEFIVATMGDIEELQNQVDGNITTWFFNGVPTLENEPANEWLTDTDKDNHLGDLYYDQDTGYAYRFMKNENDEYIWLELSDNDVAEALAIANAAKDTADGKRRVFTATPYPPYDNGDLWFKNQEIYICQVSKAEGVYEEKDFIIATKYTDDTYAVKVEEDLKVVSGTVTTIKESFDEFKVDITTTVTTQGEDIEAAKTTIKANTEEIELKVNKNGVIGAINLSEEEARIQAEKINLIGAVSIEMFDEDLKNDYDELTETVTNQGTTLTTVQGQITGRIWQQDIVDAVGNIEVGAVNLLDGSKDLSDVNSFFAEYNLTDGTNQLTYGGYALCM